MQLSKRARPLAQRILRDPLGKIFAVDYAITGTWTEPKVERLRNESKQAASTGS